MRRIRSLEHGSSRRADPTIRGRRRSLAGRDALAQGHALPESVVAVEGGANYVLDRPGRFGEWIAMRMKPSSALSA